jgi:transposase
MKPINISEREKIIKHYKNGKTAKQISQWLLIARSTVYKILSLFSKNQDINPKPYKGNNRKISEDEKLKIFKWYDENPDSTLLNTIDKLGLNISESGLCKWLARNNFTFKKRLYTQTVKSVKMWLINEKIGEKLKKT